MKKILLVILLVFSFFCLYKYNNTKKIENYFVDSLLIEKNESRDIMVKLYDNGVINTINLEDYVVGVVACEMPASFELEALKALAVAARTYALKHISKNNKYDLQNSTNYQCYYGVNQMKKYWGNSFEKYYKKIKKSVELTKNEIITYNGEVILSLYFSTSNGKTENVENVFNQKLDYLVSVDSPWDKINDYYTKVKKFEIKDFLSRLGISGNKIENFKINKRESGYVSSIIINDKSMSGSLFQSKLILNSLDFDLKVDSDIVIITTKGWGHCVGMSQYGSQGMALKGYNYKEILHHYYKNVKINYV